MSGQPTIEPVTRVGSRAASVSARPAATGVGVPATGLGAHLRAGATVPISVTDVLRGLTALGVAVSADVHFLLWYHDGFREIASIGPLFLLNAVGGAVLAVLVTAWRSWMATVLAAGFALVTLVAFYLSVSVGLFGLHELAGGGPQQHAALAEWAALAFGLAASWMLWRADLAGTRAAAGGGYVAERG